MLTFIVISASYVLGAVGTYISDGYLEFHSKAKEDGCYWNGNKWVYYKKGDRHYDDSILPLACVFWFVFWAIYIPSKLAILGNQKLHALRTKKNLKEGQCERLVIAAEREIAKALIEIDQDLDQIPEKEIHNGQG